MRASVVGAVVLVAIALGGCGNEAPESPARSETPPSTCPNGAEHCIIDE
jgi:hypothetical protein